MPRVRNISSTSLTIHTTGAETVGQAANAHASTSIFADYRSRYLSAVRIPEPPSAARFATDPRAWQGVTWGLVAGFTHWLLAEGYAIAAVNSFLSVTRT